MTDVFKRLQHMQKISAAALEGDPYVAAEVERDMLGEIATFLQEENCVQIERSTDETTKDVLIVMDLIVGVSPELRRVANIKEFQRALHELVVRTHRQMFGGEHG